MSAAAAAGSRRAGKRRIDWRRGAELLASGCSLDATAERIGCARRSLARKLRDDPEFRARVEEQRPPPPADDGKRIAALRRVLHDAIEAEVRGGNVRVILWLADRLKLVTPIDERTPEQELRDLLRGLSPDELREFEGLRDGDQEPDDK